MRKFIHLSRLRMLRGSYARMSHTCPNVRVHEIALGDTDKTAELHVNRMSETNSLLSTHPDSATFNQSAKMQETIDVIQVPVRTIAAFCKEQGIARIDILKTDAQGYDLKVIEGAANMFGVIPIIYAEATFVHCYNGQPTFGAFHDRMNDLGYRLVDLYETGFRTRYYQLSCNALFVREDVPGPRR
ncbi:FkbM family methyltransferase [Sphingosinicella sp. LHD-64]|uniref:FkbM family methyltransferase n=1 Tax=Sphingosinicella sp. LHD-64 TaxID=3072139 RepID=UPI00280D632E|nr:FkbM family methyltransferase [Sphingosinicella sp. LHD-64]MDQ8757232.1 FkbM family methyltransferase [Sphingosinicella sp. LHD-64]